MSGGTSTSCYDYQGCYSPSKRTNVIEKWLIFGCFQSNGIWGEAIITKSKFNELNSQCGVGLGWRGVIV
jgi:hypothetical protein